MKRMPALFIGHGSPMLALDHNEMTKILTELGKRIITDYGRPKAIAVVSAHWYSRGSYVNAAQKPEQIYDMYGFPQALYEVSYPALGDPQTARRIHDLTGAVMTEDWGIDHGVWTLFVHMFPDASLPVVPLSVDGTLSPHDQYAFGEKLAALREEGIVVAGSGNIVHNLMQTDWNNPHGSKEADEFDAFITEKVQERDDEAVLAYRDHPLASYAAPTPDHFLPLLYLLGASKGETPEVFNHIRNLGSISMTSYLFP